MIDNELRSAVLKLSAYCQAADWAGYEPYDALNSRIFKALPFLDFSIPRLILTQALKRSPINIRRALLIGKTQNPKALAIFLTAELKLSKLGLSDSNARVQQLIERLIALRSPGESYWCWGYSFPWQMRRGIVPIWAPNLVCTYFVASALLDAYEQCGESRCLDMAMSAAEYILDELYWAEGESVGFAYPYPAARGQIHNANFLAAALLCRVSKHTGERRFLAPALTIARYSATQQRADGSWYYGEAPAQQWIDNFHTGYNLSGLRSICRDAETTEFQSNIERGFEFYRTHFFREDGAVRYYHNRTYPIDTHCVAQAIITLLEFSDLGEGNVRLANSVFRWVMNNMWDDRGFFYYRVLRSCTIRTSYIRWTQAWMLLAMSIMCESTGATQSAGRSAIITSIHG